MSQPNPLQRLKDALLGSRPTTDEQRRQRASQFFERMREQPEDAPPPAANRSVSFSAATDLLAPSPPPALPAALDVARELERAQDNGLLNTAVRHIRKEAEAEAQVGAQVRSKLDTRREIVDSSTQLLQAQNTLKNTLYDGQILDEKKAAELHRARLARLQAEQALQQAIHPPPATKIVSAPALPSIRIPDAQIEEEAVALVVCLGDGGSEQLEGYRAELAARYPPLTVDEILSRARAIRSRRGGA